jgi:hypothetical protein
MNHHYISGLSSSTLTGGIMQTSMGSGVVSPLHSSSNAVGSSATANLHHMHMMHMPLHNHLQQKAVEVQAA